MTENREQTGPRQGTATGTATATRPDPRTARRAVVASSVGNALEWFDIIVYSSFATVIAELFFPALSGFAGLMMSFLLFAVTYLIRPLGAAVIGNYADRAGRRAALSLTILLMTVGTLLMGLAPTAATIGGVAAGLWLLVSRLVQGFSAGGEFGSATTFLVESSPDRKSFYGSWQVATQGAAMVLASLFGLVLNTALTRDQLLAWGWRVPFLFGALIGPVGFYIRRRMEETQEFRTAERVRTPVVAALTTHLPRVLASAGIVGLASISVYLILYMPTYAVKSLALPGWSGYVGGVIAGAVTLAGTPFLGVLADRVGAARVMTVAAVVAVVVAWPLFALLDSHPTVLTLTVVQVGFGIIMAGYFGPLPGLYSQLFPTEVRTSGMAVGYNIGVLVFGGFAGAIFTWLISLTGSGMAPVWYFIAVALVSLGCLLLARRGFVLR